MLLLSGEKATECTLLLCALRFSALSSKDAATRTEAVRSALRVGGCQCRHTCIPDFDRLVAGARGDGRAVGREGHGVHPLAVRPPLPRLELQGCCHKHRSSQVWAKGLGVSVPTHLHPRL